MEFANKLSQTNDWLPVQYRCSAELLLLIQMNDDFRSFVLPWASHTKKPTLNAFERCQNNFSDSWLCVSLLERWTKDIPLFLIFDDGGGRCQHKGRKSLTGYQSGSDPVTVKTVTYDLCHTHETILHMKLSLLFSASITHPVKTVMLYNFQHYIFLIFWEYNRLDLSSGFKVRAEKPLVRVRSYRA